MRFIIVGLDRQLPRAGGRDLVLNHVLLPRAREAREAPGGGRRERAREDEAARRHRSASRSGGFALGFDERGWRTAFLGSWLTARPGTSCYRVVQLYLSASVLGTWTCCNQAPTQ